MKTLALLLTLALALTARSAEQFVAGEIFLTEGPTKLGAATIKAYPLEAALKALNTYTRPEMPPALATATSDSEGRWKLKFDPATPFLLVATATHTAKRTRFTATFEWVVKSTDIEDKQAVMLTERTAKIR